jgi:sec-independent protein translocase protein TatA
MNVFGVGLPEMALILVLALLVFGPKKLPEIGRSMGKALKGFQDASREFEEEFKKEAEQIEKAVTAPMKATLEPDTQKVLTPPESATEVVADSAIAADPDAIAAPGEADGTPASAEVTPSDSDSAA